MVFWVARGCWFGDVRVGRASGTCEFPCKFLGGVWGMGCYAFLGRTGGFGITDEIAGMNRFVVDSTGRCGIGTATPAFQLHVAGACHATSFPTSSDMRFKENIQPIDNALDKVLRLNGVYLNWNHLHRDRLKRDNTKARQVGLVESTGQRTST